MKTIARHSALLGIIATWIGGFILLSRRAPDIHDAISQYSRYSETWWIFGVILTVIAALISLYGFHLQHYWKPSRNLILFGCAMFLITAWSPYDPAQPVAYWMHNFSFYIAVFCYTLACWRSTIPIHSRLGNAFLVAITVSSLAAGIAVLAKHWSFNIEVAFMIIAEVWSLVLAYFPTWTRKSLSHVFKKSLEAS